MRYLSGKEEKFALNYMNEAGSSATGSTCLRAKCGSVIAKDGEIIGRGFNSPPGGLESQRRCSCSKDEVHKKVTDKTCCMHAEQRAIMNALQHNPNKLRDSRLYFARIDEMGKITAAGEPYCTICSKMALDVDISEFVLLKREGICVYNTEEYNELSFSYKGN